MTELTFLTEINDERKGNHLCAFNGFLEDYLETIEESPLRETLKSLEALNPDFRIMVGYHFNIQTEAVSNQIIRYKDITKLPSHPFILPMMIYGKDSNEDVIGFILAQEEESFTVLKGLYYAITENKALLEPLRNNLIVDHLNEDTLKIITQLSKAEIKCGAAQRLIDGKHYADLNELKAIVKAEAEALQAQIKEDFKEHKHRAPLIYKAVTSWFLMKKVLYVQTMMNRHLLDRECGGDVKKQRHQAKLNADSVTFIAYSELWRTTSN
jgi:hypothetical protein